MAFTAFTDMQHLLARCSVYLMGVMHSGITCSQKLTEAHCISRFLSGITAKQQERPEL